MKTLDLKTIHRLLLVNIVNEEGKKGATLSELKGYFKILEKIELTEDEKKTVGLKIENDQVRWNPEKDVEVSTEISDEQVDTLKKMLKKRDEDKSFNFQTMGPMLEIAEKLGVDV